VSGEGVLLLQNDEERILREGDVVRFGDNDTHGLRNDSNRRFEYMSVTSPPLDFSGAYGVK
jgi:quercetin dioxygenase-like cupin family protein